MTGLELLKLARSPFLVKLLFLNGLSRLYATVPAIMAPEQASVNVYTLIPSMPQFLVAAAVAIVRDKVTFEVFSLRIHAAFQVQQFYGPERDRVTFTL